MAKNIIFMILLVGLDIPNSCDHCGPYFTPDIELKMHKAGEMKHRTFPSVVNYSSSRSPHISSSSATGPESLSFGLDIWGRC